MAKFTNEKCEAVCWRGIVVEPGQTVEDEVPQSKKKKRGE